MKKIKLINADKGFVKWMRERYPDASDPERTRKILSEIGKGTQLSDKLETLLKGKQRWKKNKL